MPFGATVFLCLIVRSPDAGFYDMITINDFESSPFGASRNAGVYAICNKKDIESPENILYVGSSKNINKRVYNNTHPFRFLNEFKKCKFMTTKNKLRIKCFKFFIIYLV